MQLHQRKSSRSAPVLKNEFLVKFNSYNFTDAGMARQRLNEIELAVKQSADSCLQAIEAAFQSGEETFRNPADRRLFTQAYYEGKQQCNATNTGLVGVDAKAEAKVEEFRQQLQLKGETARENEGQRIRDSMAAVVKETTAAAPATESSPSTIEASIASIIGDFYAAENAMQSTNDIEAVLRYYEFPLARYYDAYYVDRSRMAKIYADSYFNTLKQHRVYGFESNIQTEAMRNGDTKVTVGCRFEFSTQKSPADLRTRPSTNVYVLSPAGKIKSVLPA